MKNSDYRNKVYASTIKNTQEGATVDLNSKGLQFLKSSVSKAVFDMVGQALAKGSINKVDISDAAVHALVKNKAAKNILKSFINVSSENGSTHKYIIDIIKKLERKK